MRHWNKVLGGLGSLFVLADATPSFAGDGRIELTGDRSEISFSMYVAAPAVSQAEYDHIRQTLEDANRYVCDTTDGRFHLSKVDLVTGEKVRGNADAWWFPMSGRARSSTMGNFGDPPNQMPLADFDGNQPQPWNNAFANGRVVLYSPGMNGKVLAHELGHLIFGMGGMYWEDNSCGRGSELQATPSVGGTFDGYPIFRNLSGAPLFQTVSSSYTVTGRSTGTANATLALDLMQHDAEVCRNVAGQSPSDLDPLLGNDLSCSSGCLVSPFIVCDSPGSSTGGAQLGTEFSSWESFELGDAYKQAVNPDFAGRAPNLGQEAREIVVQGFLDPTSVSGAPRCGLKPDGTSDESTPAAELGARCTTLATTPRCPDSAEDRCRDTCLTDYLCDEGEIGAGSCECTDSAPPTPCSVLDPQLRGGNVTCKANCTYDFSACSTRLAYPLAPAPGITLEAFRAAASAGQEPNEFIVRAFELWDQLGDVNVHPDDPLVSGSTLNVANLEVMGPSSHPVYLFLQRNYVYGAGDDARQELTALFAMDAREFDASAAPGTLKEVGRFELQFASKICAAAGCANADGRLLEIDGVPFDPANPPRLVLGDAATTGVFVRGGSSAERRMDLAVHFENLRSRDTQVPGASTPDSSTELLVYGRYGVFTNSTGEKIEAPMYTRCTSETEGPTFNYHSALLRGGYDPQTHRGDGSIHSMSLLARQLNPDGAWSRPGYGPVTTPSTVNNIHANIEQFLNSSWDTTARVMNQRWNIAVAIADPYPVSAPLDDTACPPPTITPFASLPSFDDGNVVFVLDRSGSMAQVDSPGIFTDIKRLDYVKEGGRAVVAQLAGVAKNAGLVWFNHEVAQQVPPSGDALPPFDAAALGAALVPSTEPGEDPIPEGNTDVAAGLARAITLLSGTTGPKSIVLLTDGEANVPQPTPADPTTPVQRMLAQIDAARAAGITVTTIPTGTDADRGASAKLSGNTGGKMFDAPRSAEAIPALMQAGVDFSGQQLARSHREEPTWILDTSDGFKSHYYWSVQVEPGAEALRILVSDPGTYDGSIFEAPFGPNYELLGPGEPYDPLPVVASGAHYQLLELPNPAPGVYSIHELVAGTPFTDLFVTAHVVNSHPHCYVSSSSDIVNGRELTMLTAAAYFDDGQVVDGVEFTGKLLRPDQSQVDLEFSYDPASETHVSPLDPSLLVGRGSYTATIQCRVLEGALKAPGESSPGQAGIPDGDRSTVPFRRTVTTSFFNNSITPPPLPTTEPYAGDCDLDGIPDSEEVEGDPDGDLIPNICDGDGNKNDVPDAVDQDPSVNPDGCSLGGAPPGCLLADAGPDQLVECASAGSTVVTLDGSASQSPRGPATYSWSAPPVTLQTPNQPVASGGFPLGTTTATLTLSRDTFQASDTALVTVVDTTGPTLVAPPDVTAATCTSVNLGQATASDGCGGSVTVVNDAPASFKAGVYTVTWLAIDQFGNESQPKTQKVVVGIGDNSSCCPAGTHVIVGTSNNDTLTGTSGADCILGKGAQDTIKGMGGNDYLSGGDGDDVIEGGDGNDFIDGGSGQDTLRGQNGNDALAGGAGDDWCYGGNNDDLIRGGSGQDHLFGDSGNDALFGEDGYDTLDGGIGNDALDGGPLSDTCIGGSGINTFSACETQQ
ncbi:MAG: VWA domain-containing protein [Myxococcota bacterium]|nr:VWA domain-containing protein [Myxococcota bacterium]